jgi:hypothetical protein
MIPSGYDIHHVSRIGQKGGGVALIYNQSAEVKLVKQQNIYTHFELIECDVKAECVGFRIFVVYRPPPSKKNNFQVSAFLDELSLLLQSSTAMSEEVIITGDLNFHLDDPSDQNARKCLDILDEQGFVQHVVGATHIRGHTLDVFITRDNSSILLDKRLYWNPICVTLKEIILVITWQSLLCFKFRNLQIRGNLCHFGNIEISS